MKTKVELPETENYSLNKLTENGAFDYQDYNDNMDAIDAKLKEFAKRLAALDKGSDS